MTNLRGRTAASMLYCLQVSSGCLLIHPLKHVQAISGWGMHGLTQEAAVYGISHYAACRHHTWPHQCQLQFAHCGCHHDSLELPGV